MKTLFRKPANILNDIFRRQDEIVQERIETIEEAAKAVSDAQASGKSDGIVADDIVALMARANVSRDAFAKMVAEETELTKLLPIGDSFDNLNAELAKLEAAHEKANAAETKRRQTEGEKAYAREMAIAAIEHKVMEAASAKTEVDRLQSTRLTPRQIEINGLVRSLAKKIGQVNLQLQSHRDGHPTDAGRLLSYQSGLEDCRRNRPQQLAEHEGWIENLKAKVADTEAKRDGIQQAIDVLHAEFSDINQRKVGA